ncbi:hypothetical protein [Sphingobacterium corticibacterium]|nr:hypothetical protein [Sphingobacterium corticibacterium]
MNNFYKGGGGLSLTKANLRFIANQPEKQHRVTPAKGKEVACGH